MKNPNCPILNRVRDAHERVLAYAMPDGPHTTRTRGPKNAAAIFTKRL
jgi:hypothetical protein